MEKHGGSIRLSSNGEPDTRGTTVSIFVPFKVKSPSKRDGDSATDSQFAETSP